jgi:P27 family predicted phage terminase small subunit
MRGRKPYPTHLKLLKGNPGRRPLNGSEPAPRKMLPDPPAELSADARGEWDRVAPELYRVGLLTGVDRSALAAYCQVYGRWVQAERGIAEGGLLSMTSKGNLIQNPLVGIANKAMADMVRYAAEFGMTPSARVRVRAVDRTFDGLDPVAAKYFSDDAKGLV